MKKFFYLLIPIICIVIITVIVTSVYAGTGEISNKKICFGLKRADNHERPDLGSENLKLFDKYGVLAIGNENSKNVYLTFDLGYEAGYTEDILDTLKENNVSATFFITAHYLNTNTDLVKRMIEEGHIVGNHIPKYLMPIYL